ncbi:MAG: hypothetical protein Q9172_005690 [Xanthocarpia lactea]
MIFKFGRFFSRKVGAPSAEVVHYTAEEKEHPSGPGLVNGVLSGSSIEKTEETSGIAKRTKEQKTLKSFARTGPSTSAPLTQDRQKGRGRRILQSAKKRLLNLGKAGFGKKVPVPRNDRSWNALLPGTAHKLSERILEEAEHPRAEDSVAPGQRQQGTTGYQPMATVDNAAKSDPLPDQPPAGLHGVIPPSTPTKWKRSFHMVIHLPNDDNAQRVTCLDTGADIDVISIHVVNSLGLAKEPYNGPALKPIGGTYTPQWQVTFDWHVADRTRTYTSTFAVLDEDHSGDFDVLLGKVTVGKYDFYVVNSNVWFATTVGNAKNALPSIEVDEKDTN